MKIDEACVSCIINQSVRVADAITADQELKTELVSTIETMSKDFSFNDNPPEIASDVYETMASIANKHDLYDEKKEESNKKAKALVPRLKKELEASSDKLLTATKIAVAGNVIDLAAKIMYDLDQELNRVFHTEFAHNDFRKLEEELQKAKTVLVIGDNVGEHIFDYVYIQTLQELYPNVKYSYMVRGNPIINDVTMKEAREAKFHELCELVDSGVNTPGFAYARANKYSQELFDSVDLVISKGMGNYECLNDAKRDNICFLLKVKCNVVASSLGKKEGDIICKVKESK